MSPVNAGDTKDEVLIPGLERPPGGEDPPGKEMATHFSILAWENLIQALGSQRARQDWAHMHPRKVALFLVF